MKKTLSGVEQMKETIDAVGKVLLNYRKMTLAYPDVHPLTDDWAAAIILTMIEHGYKSPRKKEKKNPRSPEDIMK